MINKTLIIGSSPCAAKIAEDLIKSDIEVIIAAKEKEKNRNFLSAFFEENKTSAELLFDSTILVCQGHVGKFEVSMNKAGKKIKRTVSNIIIAHEDVRKPNFDIYGLSPTTGIVSLSQIKQDSEKSANKDLLDLQKGQTVFLTSLSNESNPIILKEIMTTALRLLTELRQKVYIMVGNLKVGSNGLETLYRKTREAGVVYIKFTGKIPEIEKKDKEKINLLFDDELTGKKFTLTPDLTVVDEMIIPSDYLDHLANVFGLHKDPDGFLQADNVHRNPVFTNRKGVFVAGPSRGVLSPLDHLTDAASATASVVKLINDGMVESENKAEIDSGLCIQCLTCYRICPYKAVMLDDKPLVSPEACEGCGICAAICPSMVITMKGPAFSGIQDKIQRRKTASSQKDSTLGIVAFCCSRSAARSEPAIDFSLPESLQIIEVPCAGSISFDFIFEALKNGADGVIVFTCHQGNCHSEFGNIYAKKRVSILKDKLQQIGFEKDRLMLKTRASNMDREFFETMINFEKHIENLGASSIGRRKKG